MLPCARVVNPATTPTDSSSGENSIPSRAVQVVPQPSFDRRREREDRADHRGTEHDEPVVVTGGGDESEREEREHAGAAGEAVHSIGEVDPVRSRHDRDERDQDEDHTADHPTTDERYEHLVHTEVALDVDRGRQTDDRLPDELVAPADAEPIRDVHPVIDRAERAHGDEGADGDDGLRNVDLALALRKEEEHEDPEERHDADEEEPTHRGDPLLREVPAWSFAADVLPHPEPAQQLDIRAADHEADQEGREHHAQGEDRGGHQAIRALGRASASARRSSASECEPLTRTVSPRRRMRRSSIRASAASATVYVSRIPDVRAALTMVRARSPIPTSTSALVAAWRPASSCASAESVPSSSMSPRTATRRPPADPSTASAAATAAGLAL